MKTYRAFAVSVIPSNGSAPRRVKITDHGCDINKVITSDDPNTISMAIRYLEDRGIDVHGITRAIRERDVRILTLSDTPLT